MRNVREQDKAEEKKGRREEGKTEEEISSLIPHPSSLTLDAQHPHTLTPLQWKVHLSQREPQRLPKLLSAIVLTSAVVLVAFKSVWLALISIVLLVGATGEFLFPVAYRLTDEGVFANVLLNRLALKWADIKRCVPNRDGVLLTPLEFPSRSDAFRGIFLRFAPDGETGDRTEVMEQIALHLPTILPEQFKQSP